jgi:Txe/YoeB family toxin of Txe-Axe toxin-antitoxin module
MRSLVFEGDTWSAYEQLRQSDKKLHENLCKILKEMMRGDPKTGLINLNRLNIIYLAFGREGYHKEIE